MNKYTESLIKNLPTQKSPGSDNFPGEIYQTFKELMPTLLKFFWRTEEQKILWKSFYEARITLKYQKPERDTTEQLNWNEMKTMGQ